MFAGKPILLAVDGDASRLVQAAAAGIVAESGNPSSIAEAALALAALEPSELAGMGDRAARYYAAHLSRENGTARFAALFDRVAAGT
jgi:glycosyltransferase involved in cell wall biosynthesis